MSGQIAKGDDFQSQAEKKLKGPALFDSKHEDAAELYEKAADFTNLENPVSLSHFELWSLKLDCILSYR
ncbi:hypothetical protein L6452_17410 [Arctium lappa]|uniref:Uncharacterized protein n=1 Tax=Arctium lappa TaxID=4217 RepID=A0ACB9C3E3_ARCLA|nr:hypothetical protein L6452_17410 [Arctium lappa]